MYSLVFLTYFCCCFVSLNRPQVEQLQMELASSKSALDEQYKRWRTAQDNYERQVLLLVPPIYVITIFLGWRIREASHFASSMVEIFYSSLILTAYDWCLNLSNLT